jgi:hypothetical protein
MDGAEDGTDSQPDANRSGDLLLADEVSVTGMGSFATYVHHKPARFIVASQSAVEPVREPADREVGLVPAFRDSLEDRQIAEIAAYMRQRNAPGPLAWRDFERDVTRVRREPASP